MLVVLSGFAELASIGSVIPFLTFLAGLQMNSLPDWVANWVNGFGLDTKQLTIAATLVLVLTAVIAGMVRLLLVWKSHRFVFGASYDISVEIYDTAMHLPYPEHAARNSAEFLSDLNKAQMLAGTLFMPVVQAAGSGVIALFLIVGLLLIDVRVALAAGIGLGLIYALVVTTTRSILARNAVTVARAWADRIKVANEGLGGIRDIILDRTHDTFIARFKSVEKGLERAQFTNYFLGAGPRFIVEALGIILFAAIALALSLAGGGLVSSLPVLAAMALGAQRLLPLIQNVYAGWAATAIAREMLADVVQSLGPKTLETHEMDEIAPQIGSVESIRLEGVCFRYPGASAAAISDINLNIKRGERIGIGGRSGSGKSTLMDLLLGLQLPTAGRVIINGRPLDSQSINEWRRKVAHVPQAIYLADATIAENIAFGAGPDEVEWRRLKDAAKRSQLLEFVDQLRDGLETRIGERGARLSGGQRQRIGIARALYKNAELLVLDEATSALDTATEEEVNAAIRALDRNLTIIVISHRPSSLSLCERWLWIENGQAREVGQKMIAEKSGVVE